MTLGEKFLLVGIWNRDTFEKTKIMPCLWNNARECIRMRILVPVDGLDMVHDPFIFWINHTNDIMLAEDDWENLRCQETGLIAILQNWSVESKDRLAVLNLWLRMGTVLALSTYANNCWASLILHPWGLICLKRVLEAPQRGRLSYQSLLRMACL